MNNPQLTKSFYAQTALTKFRIVVFGSTGDDYVVPAAGVSDKLVGVTTDVDTAINARADVIADGLCDVEYGGTVTRGDKLTSDASGRAVTAAPGAGVNNHIIGIAWVSGVIGDIGSVKISQGIVQG